MTIIKAPTCSKVKLIQYGEDDDIGIGGYCVVRGLFANGWQNLITCRDRDFAQEWVASRGLEIGILQYRKLK